MSPINESKTSKKTIDGSSDLVVDPEQTKEPRRPADLRWKFYKDPSHGDGLRVALLDMRVMWRHKRVPLVIYAIGTMEYMDTSGYVNNARVYAMDLIII